MQKSKLKILLDTEYDKRNVNAELSPSNPDPLMIAREYTDDKIVLTCALFSYGNAKQIVKFLQTLPFHLLDRAVSEESIRKELEGKKYRFQNTEDIIQWFLLLSEIRKLEKKEQRGREPKKSKIYTIFLEYYQKNQDVIEGIKGVINFLYSLTNYQSRGFCFFIGHTDTDSTLKRWNMFLRWMVRKDNLDLGLWNGVRTEDLIIPLDTHLFKVGKQMGLLSPKSPYTMKSAIEITNNLKEFDNQDPVKYDFVIYRIGQENLKSKY